MTFSYTLPNPPNSAHGTSVNNEACGTSSPGKKDLENRLRRFQRLGYGKTHLKHCRYKLVIFLVIYIGKIKMFIDDQNHYHASLCVAMRKSTYSAPDDIYIALLARLLYPCFYVIGFFFFRK